MRLDLALIQEPGSPEPTPQEADEAQRAVKRLGEYDDTINHWQQIADEAQIKANDTRRAREGFLRALPYSSVWTVYMRLDSLPTVPGTHARAT